MADLSTHYKERTPQETVQIIKNFFYSHGLKTKEIDVDKSEAGTWFGHIDLFQDDVKLCGSNGKGVSLEYAMASGYAELYERFCNGMTFLANPWWNKAVTETNFTKHGYYLREDEKLLKPQEAIHNSHYIDNFFHIFCKDNEDFKIATVDYLTYNRCIGLPMINIADNNDKLYVDPRILIRVTASIGMSAGNTLEEALNQGCSEIVEKYAYQKFFTNWTEDTYHVLKLENIANPQLQNIINNIKKEGYDFYLFDLSYNYQVPVMMSLLIDKQKNIINMNFGAFPVFDIAAERVLTELYQGIRTYRDQQFLMRLQTPFKTIGSRDLFSIYANSINGSIFNEDLLSRIQYEDNYNTDIFIEKENSNDKILQYYRDLSKLLNIKFYYLDNSLCKDMYAVHILCEGTKDYTGDGMYVIPNDPISIKQMKNNLNRLSNFYNELYNNKVDYLNFLELLTNDSNIITNDYFGKMRLWNDFIISENNGRQYENLLSLISSDNNGVIYDFGSNNISFDIIYSFLYIPFKKYLQLKQYINCGVYNSQEILNIFNNLFNYNITQEDINKCGNTIYLLKKAYIEPMYQFLHSEKYSQIIDMFIK